MDIGLNKYRLLGGACCNNCIDSKKCIGGGIRSERDKTIEERENIFNNNRLRILKMAQNRSLENTQNKPVNYYINIGNRSFY